MDGTVGGLSLWRPSKPRSVIFTGTPVSQKKDGSTRNWREGEVEEENGPGPLPQGVGETNTKNRRYVQVPGEKQGALWKNPY